MKKLFQQILDEAFEQASRSTHRTFLHGAVLLHRSKILASGYNRHACHAEVAAFKNLKTTLARPDKYIVFVIRINKTGQLCCSKPCSTCMSYLRFRNVQCVYYSSSERTIEKMTL